MSKLFDARSKCPCGADIRAAMARPTWMAETISKFTCRDCGSKFLLTAKRLKSDKGERLIRAHFKVMELSEKATAALKQVEGA